MKKIYWVGDMINNTGPAIVNKEYYAYLKNDAYFCFTNNKLLRSLDLLTRIFYIKTIVISGFSKLNYILAVICKKFNKKIIYLMHGYDKEELKYTNNYNKKVLKREYCLLKSVDKIVCVSEIFSNYLKKDIPEFKNKIFFVNNGVEKDSHKNTSSNNSVFQIISVGGGMKRKQNLAICEAISKINDIKIKFVVVGKNLNYGDEIKKFPFVEYYESLPHEEVLKKMSESNLYIQNSYFETFGLAVVEALNCGCDILISKNIGALSILNNVTENDIILDNEDINEIISKIKIKINSRGNIFYDKNKCSWKNRSNEILKVIGG